MARDLVKYNLWHKEYYRKNKLKFQKIALDQYRKHKKERILAAKKWANEHPEARKTAYTKYHKSIKGRETRRKFQLSKFGITIKQYNEMLEEQQGLCLICKQPQTVVAYGKVKPLCVDHCHKTGKVRGLLCDECNTSLGKLKENTTTLRNMIEYLERNIF